MYRFTEDAKRGFREYSEIMFSVNTRQAVTDLVTRAEEAYNLMAPCLNGQSAYFKQAIEEADRLNRVRMGERLSVVYADVGMKASAISDNLVSKVARELQKMRPKVIGFN